MKILNKKLVEEAADNKYRYEKGMFAYTNNIKVESQQKGFKAGAKWAESQMEELAIEFLEYYLSNKHPFDKDVFCVNENYGK